MFYRVGPCFEADCKDPEYLKMVREIDTWGLQKVTCCRCGEKILMRESVSAIYYAQQLTALGINHAVESTNVLCKPCNTVTSR